jgi:hypothetical protein
VLILLPPSEGKAAAATGPPLELGALSFGELTTHRERVLDALAHVSAGPGALAALGVAPGLAQQVARNVGLRAAPAQAASRVYTGVLYEALGLRTLSRGPRARAEASVLVVSALFGVLRPGDRIPAYRLSMDVELAGIGPLAASWRPQLEPVIAAAAGDGLVIDCRSATYAAAWRPAPAHAERLVHVRVLREHAGQRTVVSHMAKQTRGAVARRLLTTRRRLDRVPDVVAALRAEFTVETVPPARAGQGWTLDVVVRDA